MTEELRFGFETRQVYHDRVHQLLEIYQRSTEVSKGVTDDDNITSSVVLLKPNSNHNDLVLISGPSGVGKTCLALSLEEQIMKQDGGFLCRGKFDQATFCPFVHDGNQDETPIATQQTSHRPFVTAMTDLVQQILRRGDRDFINLLQSELEEALDSSEIQALETNIPCLYQITRPPSSLSPNKKQELDGDERWLSLKGPDAEKRFVQIFTKLCQTISNSLNQRNSRMVMLIDDLQWADTHSLQLLQKLLVTATSPTEASASNKGLMVICTARLDEIASDDPLALVLMSNHESEARDPLSTLLSELKQSGVNVTEIPLDNLTKSATHELLSSFFKLPVTDTESLAQVVYHQTNGNLFYIMQFLSVLQGEGHLYVCPTMNRWKWNEQDILKTSLLKPKSIVTLLTQKILQLPDPEQHILRVAACLGGTIYDCLLEERVTYTPTSVQSALATLKQQHGLITFDFDTRCGSFVHNRIQEAAYSLIPTSHRAAVHLDLGRQLWKQLTPTDLDTHLFTVVSQIQRGLHLLDDRIEKEDLAALMLRAGEKAVRMSSFADAANYFGTGIHLLGRRRGWKHQYALSLALHNAAAEVEYYNGNLERVDSLLADVFVNAKSLDHKLRAHITQIYSLGSRDDMKQALAQGLEVLKSLGVTFPRRPGKMYASFALSRCRRLFQTKSDDDIMNLPLMNDKRQLVVMRLLNTIYGYAFSNNESLVALIATKMIETTFQYGISALSCVGLALLGFCLGHHGHAEESYRLGHLALQLMERFQAKEWQCRVALLVFGGVYSVHHPLKELSKPLQSAHRAGLVAGDINASLVCASFQCRVNFYASETLPRVVETLEDYKRLSVYYGQMCVGMMLNPQLQVCFNFMGRVADPLVLTGEVMDEKATLAFLDGKHPVALTWILLTKHLLAVYFQDLERARSIANVLKKMKMGAVLPFVLHNHLFLEGLTAATLSRTEKSQTKRAQQILLKLKSVQRGAGDNYENKIHLMEAEIAASRGNRDHALFKYRQAIEASRRQGFLHEQALACEKAANSLFRWGDLPTGRDYLVSASSLYAQWGAFAKVSQIHTFLRGLKINCIMGREPSSKALI